MNVMSCVITGEEGGVQHSTGVRTGPHSKPHLYDEDTLIPVAVKVRMCGYKDLYTSKI